MDIPNIFSPKQFHAEKKRQKKKNKSQLRTWSHFNWLVSWIHHLIWLNRPIRSSFRRHYLSKQAQQKFINEAWCWIKTMTMTRYLTIESSNERLKEKKKALRNCNETVVSNLVGIQQAMQCDERANNLSSFPFPIWHLADSIRVSISFNIIVALWWINVFHHSTLTLIIWFCVRISRINEHKSFGVTNYFINGFQCQ